MFCLCRRTRRVRATRIFCSDELLAELEGEALSWAPFETGRMLLGFRREAALVVTRTIPAGPNAIRERSRFVPDGEWQQRRLEEAYVASGRLDTYLGDWHTHPDGTPSPSRLDRRTYARVAKEPNSRTTEPVVLITGLNENDAHVGAWIVRGRRLRPIELLRA